MGQSGKASWGIGAWAWQDEKALGWEWKWWLGEGSPAIWGRWYAWVGGSRRVDLCWVTEPREKLLQQFRQVVIRAWTGVTMKVGNRSINWNDVNGNWIGYPLYWLNIRPVNYYFWCILFPTMLCSKDPVTYCFMNSSVFLRLYPFWPIY